MSLDKNVNNCYLTDIYSIWSTLPSSYKLHDKYIVWYPHDRVEHFFEFPILVKTREIHVSPPSTSSSILFKLNSIRHFHHMEQYFKYDTMNFLQKKPCLIWRGAPTGYGFSNNIPYRPVSRQVLVEKWFSSSSNYVDIGLVFSAKQRIAYSSYIQYEKPSLTKIDFMSFKYILSVEGNDVASNLKWIMTLNSVVFMPLPIIESWFLESKLEPYVHFIPIDNDFSNLETQVLWAEEHPNICLDIIQNCHAYIQKFCNIDNELELQQDILKWYIDSFTWTV